MKKLFLKKIFLSVLIVSLLSFGLTGCESIDGGCTCNDDHTDIEYAGKVYIVVSGPSIITYDIIVDGYCYFSNVPPGTYTLTNIPLGDTYLFRAVSSEGASCYAAGSNFHKISDLVTYVYIDPEIQYSKIYIYVSGEGHYNVKMDGKTYFNSVPEGEYILKNVQTGKYHTFEASNSYEWDIYYIYVDKCIESFTLYPKPMGQF